MSAVAESAPRTRRFSIVPPLITISFTGSISFSLPFFSFEIVSLNSRQIKDIFCVAQRYWRDIEGILKKASKIRSLNIAYIKNGFNLTQFSFNYQITLAWISSLHERMQNSQQLKLGKNICNSKEASNYSIIARDREEKNPSPSLSFFSFFSFHKLTENARTSTPFVLKYNSVLTIRLITINSARRRDPAWKCQYFNGTN